MVLRMAYIQKLSYMHDKVALSCTESVACVAVLNPEVLMVICNSKPKCCNGGHPRGSHGQFQWSSWRNRGKLRVCNGLFPSGHDWFSAECRHQGRSKFTSAQTSTHQFWATPQLSSLSRSRRDSVMPCTTPESFFRAAVPPLAPTSLKP
jgi:hypothetical protein